MPLPITRGAASAKGFGFTQGGSSSYFPIGTTFTFTPAGVIGPLGPSGGDFSTAYTGQLFYPTYFNSSSGLQFLLGLPAGVFQIVAAGAQGNDPTNNSGTGGQGSVIYGNFNVSAGEALQMIVGQRGKKVFGGALDSQPGGGASWFWLGTSGIAIASATRYGVAGGGGGACNGGTGNSSPQNVTGANSSGSNTGNGGSATDYSAGGAGFNTDGGVPDNNGGYAAQKPDNGGRGFRQSFSNAGGDGGFGGGGGQTNSGGNRCGGGAGYTGGDGYNANPGGAAQGAPGGGSKLVGLASGPSGWAGASSGNGYISIYRIS